MCEKCGCASVGWQPKTGSMSADAKSTIEHLQVGKRKSCVQVYFADRTDTDPLLHTKFPSVFFICRSLHATGSENQTFHKSPKAI